MLNFAPVCPIHIAKALHEKGALGNYHLLLAHDILKHPSDYQSLYGSADIGTVILDNSASELGEAVSIQDMLAAAMIVSPDVFILPDVIMDSEMTIAKTIAALKAYQQLPNMEGIEFMAVPQGNTRLEFLFCTRVLANMEGVDWIGIPRNVRKKLHFKRNKVVMMLNEAYPDTKIHLLGMSGDLHDEHLSHKHYHIEGMDSSAPVYMGMRDNEHVQNISRDTERGNWWETQSSYDENDLLDAITNIEYIREGERF